MIRNSLLYHRFWYIKKHGLKRFRVYFRIFLAFFVLSGVIYYFNKTLMPAFSVAVEAKARSEVNNVIYDAVYEVFDENLDNENVVALKRDGFGHIRAVEADIAKLNRLSARVSMLVGEKLSQDGGKKISIPFGMLLGNTIFSDLGPDLYISVRSAGYVNTQLKSEFSSAGINQTRHRIYLEVNAEINIIAPLFAQKIKIANTIPLAETVIVGKVPSIYMEANG